MFRFVRLPLVVATAVATVLGLGALPAVAQPVTSTSQAPPAATAAPHTPSVLPASAGQRASVTPAGCNTADLRPGEATCFALLHTNPTTRQVPMDEAPQSGWLTPSDIRSAYRLPDSGSGQTVAIVDAFGDPSAESDLAMYRQQFGLPACTTANGCFRKVDQRGDTNYPQDDVGWGEETSLDLDAVSAACPGCHILLVEADDNMNPELGTAVQTAVRLGARFVSNSYGQPGENPNATAETQWEHPGVVVAAATGDTGNVVNFPASDPDVVAVGGTSLSPDPASARGWDESAWSSGGSGCSNYEPQPAYQLSLPTDCPRRAISDVSAVADPSTGMAIYDTFGGFNWFQVGGTSMATPLVTAMYALAGTPTDGTFPVTYPYASGGQGLFDVTQGSDGSCGNVLCTAGQGWDGPTGLGSPDGVTALREGPVGTATGRVTDQATGAPLPGVRVRLDDPTTGRTYNAVTDNQGQFTTTAAVGTYDLTATLFGYAGGTQSGLRVGEGATATANLTLAQVPSRTVTGTVLDNSGHGWPLYARITVDGDPDPVFTDPATGAYSLRLPRDADYTLHVAPVYPGYQTTDLPLTIGDQDVHQNVGVGVNTATCSAAGYGFPLAAGFDSGAQGWTVSGTTDPGWVFDDPANEPNLTGGTGGFALADPLDDNGAAEVTDLTSPVVDLSGEQSVDLHFDTAFAVDSGGFGEVDLSVDGGRTWAPVWHQTVATFGGVDVPLTAAQGKPKVKVRFHFDSGGESLWEVDDVQLGTCSAVPESLIEGNVTDGNTGAPVNGAVITDAADPTLTASTGTTPDDSGLPDGFYSLFRPGLGSHRYTVSADRYTSTGFSTTGVANGVRTQNAVLGAGRLTVTSGTTDLHAQVGKQDTTHLVLTNTGTRPVRVTLGTHSLATTGATGATGSGSWQSLPSYPEAIEDNVVGYYQGRTYSFGGDDMVASGTVTKDSYVYDPATGAWSAIAPLPTPLANATGAFVDGTMYVVGGFGVPVDDTPTTSAVYAYHPATDTWSQQADLPTPLADAGVAVLDHDLYVIGGCSGDCSLPSSVAYRYSPATNRWSRVANYPSTVEWHGCAGLADADEIACTGGLTNPTGDPAHAAGTQLSSTYLYHPGRNTWTRAADLPYGNDAMVTSGANGEFQVAGGLTADAESTSRAEQYDPVHNVWTALPDLPDTTFRSRGSGCGLTVIGGSPPVFEFPVGGQTAEFLAGYDQCGGDSVDWLTTDPRTITLSPGRSTTVTVRADAGTVRGPGQYAASVSLDTDTPYVQPPVTVHFTVSPPASWGALSGNITDAATGSAVPGATVRLCDTRRAGCGQTVASTTTDAHGAYTVWTAPSHDQLNLVVTAHGYTTRTVPVRIVRGVITNRNVALSHQ